MGPAHGKTLKISATRRARLTATRAADPKHPDPCYQHYYHYYYHHVLPYGSYNLPLFVIVVCAYSQHIPTNITVMLDKPAIITRIVIRMIIRMIHIMIITIGNIMVRDVPNCVMTRNMLLLSI